jgi:hypothetical protein
MPKYQIYFDTEAGWINFDVDIDEDEVLEMVLPDILHDLEQHGYMLEGEQEGKGEVYVRWEGRELDQTESLPQQGVRPNDILRVAIEANEPLLQLRRDNQLSGVVQKEELREGDEIIVGRTMLRFHISKQQKPLDKSTTFIQRFREGRSFKQTVYFMALVGGIAGLSCWFVVALFTLVDSSGSKTDLMNYPLLGAFIGGLSIGFNDHWLGDRVVGRWVLMGILAGALAGVMGGLIAYLVSHLLGEQFPLLARAISWMITGALIGFCISLRWFAISKSRVLHGLIGGLFGGMLGGMAYWSLLELLPGGIAQALGFVLTGIGIACGVSLAPILLRQGMIEFATSGDREVLKKYVHNRKQWEIHNGGKYIIGSLSAAHTQSMFAPEVQIYIPDQLVAERHAILTSRKGRYYIEPHPSLSSVFRSAPPVR